MLGPLLFAGVGCFRLAGSLGVLCCSGIVWAPIPSARFASVLRSGVRLKGARFARVAARSPSATLDPHPRTQGWLRIGTKGNCGLRPQPTARPSAAKPHRSSAGWVLSGGGRFASSRATSISVGRSSSGGRRFAHHTPHRSRSTYLRPAAAGRLITRHTDLGRPIFVRWPRVRPPLTTPVSVGLSSPVATSAIKPRPPRSGCDSVRWPRFAHHQTDLAQPILVQRPPVRWSRWLPSHTRRAPGLVRPVGGGYRAGRSIVHPGLISDPPAANRNPVPATTRRTVPPRFGCGSGGWLDDAKADYSGGVDADHFWSQAGAE